MEQQDITYGSVQEEKESINLREVENDVCEHRRMDNR